MIQNLNERGGDFIARLETASEDTARAIAVASDQAHHGGLNFKTDHVGDEFNEIARGLEDMMTSRLDQVTEGFSEKSLAIVDMMVNRSQELTDLVSGRARELTDAIIDTSSTIAETIATRAPRKSTARSRRRASRSFLTSICAAAKSRRSWNRPGPGSPKLRCPAAPR